MDPLVLIRDGHPLAAIQISPAAPSDVQKTARDLSDILFRMSGASLPVVSTSVGAPRLILAVQPDDGRLTPPSCHVWREGDAVFFSGGSDFGVVNGVYSFLESLGCRWYTPDALGEHIPNLTTVEIGELDIQNSPDYGSVGGFGRYSDDEPTRDWKRRNRLDGFPQQFYGHNWSGIMPPGLLKEHPEWFALVGKRRNPRQFCTTQPEVLRRTVTAACTWFDEHPEMETFSLSPGDFRGFCQCGRCRALDAEIGVDPFVPDGSMTDRLVHFFNQVATEVAKVHPDRRLAFYAYMQYTRPPKVAKLHPMLRPVLVHTPWDYCMHHAIDDPKCERNRPFAKLVRRWSRLSPDLGHRDYWGHWAIYGPIGMVHTIRRDLPWMHRHGSVGIYAEGKPEWWTQGLNLYLPLKLAWDVDADVDSIVAEYYHHMFGPAATAVSRYGQLFEDAMESVPKDVHSDFDGAYIASITPELIAHAESLLNEGEQALASSSLPAEEARAVAVRLKRYGYGLRITALQAAEKRGRLARDMVQVIDCLRELIALVDEIVADPELADTIDVHSAKRFAEIEIMRLPNYHDIWARTVPSADRRKELLDLVESGRGSEVAKTLGYWTDWNIAGLWLNDEGDLLDTPYPPEAGVDLAATYDVRSGRAGWRPYQCDNAYGIVDLAKFFYPEDSEYTVAYAYTELETRTGAKARCEITCDDDIVLWVNDELVFAGGAVTGNFDIHCHAHLRKGRNAVLAKVLNKPHAFEFSIRIVNEQGMPHDAVIWD